MWLQIKAIDNSTFRNESDIGKAVSDWTCKYTLIIEISLEVVYIMNSSISSHDS